MSINLSHSVYNSLTSDWNERVKGESLKESIAATCEMRCSSWAEEYKPENWGKEICFKQMRVHAIYSFSGSLLKLIWLTEWEAFTQYCYTPIEASCDAIDTHTNTSHRASGWWVYFCQRSFCGIFSFFFYARQTNGTIFLFSTMFMGQECVRQQTNINLSMIYCVFFNTQIWVCHSLFALLNIE